VSEPGAERWQIIASQSTGSDSTIQNPKKKGAMIDYLNSYIIISIGTSPMPMQTKCPNCGAQVASTKKDSIILCQYCGTTLDVIDIKELTSKEIDGLGYTPDPPAAYSPPADTDIAGEVESPQTVIINGKPVEIPLEVVSKVINTGRNFSRYFILAIAVIMTLCSICFMFGLFQN
jgi:endogenous inhibitor of DNA gyrase (YacG/DUF329 family)